MTECSETSVWQYSTALETDSPRFTQPGDFLVYIVFLKAVILVSEVYLRSVLELYALASFHSKNLAFCPLSPLARAVPEAEGDHPCALHELVIRINSKESCRV